MTTATLAPPATDIELFVTARRQYLNQIEAKATRLMPERAREPLKGRRDRAAAEFDRALASEHGRDKIKIGIEAPMEVNVDRLEVWEKKQRNNGVVTSE